MTVSVKVSGLFNSLVHKGSDGVSVATLPDVCKTPAPGGPVPIPYPNVSMSSMLAKGSTTVKADGGMMIATKGSEFSISNGDEAGVAGGVVSSTFMKESSWILYAFDVKIDGANACRLTDKKFHNHQNTVNLAGELQAPVPIPPAVAAEVAVICTVICRCDAAPAIGAAGQSLKQQCVSSGLQALDDAAGNRSTIKPEINYNMTTAPPSPIMSRSNPLRGTSYLPSRTSEIPGFRAATGMVRRPDAVIVSDPSLPPVQTNLRAVVEIKFPPDSRDAAQIRSYQRIAGSAPVVELSPEACQCSRAPQPEPEPEPEPLPKPGAVELTLLTLALLALVLDDATGAGAADDALIPGVLARMAMAF